MCNPALIGVVIQGVATIGKGIAAKQQGKQAQTVANYNAALLEQEAIKTRKKGAEAEGIHREKVANLISSQKAASAASGVEVGTGSAAQIREDTAVMGEADALRIRTHFGEAATNLETEAEFTRTQGTAAAKAGRQAFAGGLLSAAGGFLGSDVGGGVASTWFTPDSAINLQGGAAALSTGIPGSPGAAALSGSGYSSLYPQA
jgi:hypothetical protein